MVKTIGSLFSGIGGLDLAAHWAGFETAWFVEKEPFCQKVLAKHWPNVPIYDDVLNVSYPPSVDVIVGGFPCQPFSVAGQQRGEKDERYLLPEMLRIVDEVKPYAVLFENVPGFTKLHDGNSFKYLLRALAEMGFDAQWGHIRASDVGAPHQRERWFCVAYSEGVNDRRNSRTVANPPSHSWQQNDGSVLSGSGETMADTASLRCERHPEGQRQDRFQQGRTSELARGNLLNWATPQARDWKGETGVNRHSDNLPDQITGGKLNPEFVELLMGFPIGWTSLDFPPAPVNHSTPMSRHVQRLARQRRTRGLRPWETRLCRKSHSRYSQR